MFWLHTVVLSKTRKLQFTNRVNLSVFTFILRRHYRQFFTVFYPFHKINSSRHNHITAFEIRYFNVNSNQRRYRSRHWIPMFSGTPCIGPVLSIKLWNRETALGLKHMQLCSVHCTLCTTYMDLFILQSKPRLFSLSERQDKSRLPIPRF